MKATPIAQYLDQKGRSGPVEWPPHRREATPFKPRASVPSDESAPAASAFRRSGLIAALPARASEAEARAPQSATEPETRRRESVLFQKREPAPAPDVDARLAEAYQRGRREGLEAGKAEGALARAQDRAEARSQAKAERIEFQANEYAKLAGAIASGFEDVERRIADVVARLLQPFVTEAISNQIVGELVDNIHKLSRSDGAKLIRIRGPQRLLSALQARIGSFAVNVEYAPQERVELSVEAGATTLRSELAPWVELIATLAESA